MSAAQIVPLEGPEAWYGADLARSDRWRFRFGADELAELDAAIARVRERGLPWSEMTRNDFPLDRTRRLLDRVAEELENGCGLVNLKGFPVARYDDADLGRAWFGVALNLGTPIYQDYRGQRMRDITDERQDTDAVLNQRLLTKDGEVFHSSKARTASNGSLRFHTDRCDVVGLFCIRQAARGGLSKLASSVTVHNEMIRRRPDLAELLYDVIHRSRHGEEKGGEALTYGLPVFGVRGGKFTSHYSRTYVESAQEMAGVPDMTARQWEALDLLAELAEETCMTMMFEPGDMQLVNNHVVYHARTAYEDAPDTGGDARRCLRRIWLAMPNSRALPEDHAVLWRNVDPGAIRGGIVQAQ